MSSKELDQLQKKIKPFAKAQGMVYVGLFGSTARGQNTKNSDVDLLVRFEKPVSLIKLISIENKIAKKLKKKVDLVTEKSIHPRIQKEVLKDIKVLYEGS